MKRVKIALAFLLVALVGVIAWQAKQPGDPEPVYQGKPLAEWLEIYATNAPPQARAKADEAVRHIGAKAIPTLLRLLRAKDSALKTRLMVLLAKQHIRINCAEDQNKAALLAFRVLGTNAQSAVPELVEIVNQNISPASERAAVEALGYIGPPAQAAAPSLFRCMTNADWSLRYPAVVALGRIRADPARVLPVLTNALHDPNQAVRIGAVGALGDFGSITGLAVSALVAFLNVSTNAAERLWTTNALIQLGAFEFLAPKNQSAVPALLALASQGSSHILQLNAIRALGIVHPPAREAVPSLLAWATDSFAPVRCYSIETLGKIAAESAWVVPVLIHALDDPIQTVRIAALRALAEFGPDASPAVPALLELLNSQDPHIDKLEVTNTLKAIDPEAAAKAGIKNSFR